MTITAASTMAMLAWRLGRLAPIAEQSPVVGGRRRIVAGERGVRVEVAGWGPSARHANLFNVVAQAVDDGLVTPTILDPDTASSPRSLYAALRTAGGNRAPTGDAAAGSDAAAQTTFVAIIAVDRFAALRQSIGYRLANRLLERLAQRITETVDSVETGRIGRTTIEFALAAASEADAAALLVHVVDAAEQRITIDDYAFDLTVTIGFADAGASSIRDELVDQAAAALAFAQRDHVKIRFADPVVLDQQSVADLTMMRGLPQALAAGEIDLHYQPKLDARSDRIPSVEALLRWHSPIHGLIPTDRFVALAEESGAIRELSIWVLERALRDQSTLVAAGHPVLVYVNVSGLLVADRDFARHVLDLIGDGTGRIGFEITETAVIDDPAATLENLRAFTAAGIRIAIDDYGSGLSSLAYLKQLPADELKIDRMFVSGLTKSHRDPLLVRSSIDLAHALDMEVTAEGVDDPLSLSLLRVMGCDLLQGYLISRPLPLGALIDFLDAGRFEPAAKPVLDGWPQRAAGA